MKRGVILLVVTAVLLVVFGSGIELHPTFFAALLLSVANLLFFVTAALRGQNVQVASGVLNQPPVKDQLAFQVAVQTQGRLSDPNEFANIVVKQTGDGFFASFESGRAAVEAAVAIQRALAAEIVAPDVRIGAHAGVAFRTDSDASDYGGQGVHVAARVGAAAGAGEILVSVETLEGVAGGFRLSEPRLETLKGVDAPVEVVAVDWR